MVICGSYMFEFSVSKDMKKNNILREVAVGKVEAHLCLTLIVKKLKISVEHGRVVTTLNIIFCVVFFVFIYYGPCRKFTVAKCKLSIVC